MKRWALVAMYTISVVASLCSMFVDGANRPWMVYVFGFLAACLLLYPLAVLVMNQLVPYWFIRSTVKQMAELIRAKGKPDILIAFDRSSGILACMLAQNLAVPEVLVINRHRITVKHDDAAATTVSVGDGLTLSKSLDAKRKAVVAFHVRTGDTLHQGLSFLNNQSVDRHLDVFAMYMTNGAKARWPRIPFLRTSTGEVPRHFLPWVSGPYPHD